MACLFEMFPLNFIILVLFYYFHSLTAVKGPQYICGTDTFYCYYPYISPTLLKSITAYSMHSIHINHCKLLDPQP